MPDSKIRIESINHPDLTSLAAQCQQLLPSIVWHICQRFHRSPAAEKIEDYVEEMLLYLLADDYHHLRLYDPDKGKLKTWLNVVTEHKLVYEFKHEKAWDSLDETIAEQLWELPQQERNVITQEDKAAVVREVAKLSVRKQQLFHLLCEGFTPAEIAKRMNIKPASVHQRKHELILILQTAIKNGGAKIVPEVPQRKMKIIEKNEVRFFTLGTIGLVKAAIILNPNFTASVFLRIKISIVKKHTKAH